MGYQISNPRPSGIQYAVGPCRKNYAVGTFGCSIIEKGLDVVDTLCSANYNTQYIVWGQQPGPIFHSWMLPQNREPENRQGAQLDAQESRLPKKDYEIPIPHPFVLTRLRIRSRASCSPRCSLMAANPTA